MRARSRGTLDKSWYRITDYNANGTVGSVTGPVFSSSGSNGEYQTTTDVLTTDFLRRRAAGGVFMNPFSTSKTKRSTTVENLIFGPHPVWGKRQYEGTLACHWSVPPVRPAWFNTRITDAKSRTLLEAHSRVASESFQGFVTAVETSKTAKMIARPFGQASDLINQIAGRKLRLMQKGLSATKAFAQAWAEYRFGWKPLLLDVQGMFDAYIDNTSMHVKPVRLVARASDRDIRWDSVGNITTSAPSGLTQATMRANYSHSAKVSSGVLYELTDDTLTDATARRMGLRLSDVPSALWEVVPYSFIVDRFLDVGTWLKAITPKPGVKILGSWTSVVDYQLNFHQLVEARVDVSNTPATSYRLPGGKYSEEIVSITRIANPLIPPLPTVNYRDLNLVQQVDHAVLITQRLLNLKPRS